VAEFSVASMPVAVAAILSRACRYAIPPVEPLAFIVAAFRAGFVRLCLGPRAAAMRTRMPGCRGSQARGAVRAVLPAAGRCGRRGSPRVLGALTISGNFVFVAGAGRGPHAIIAFSRPQVAMRHLGAFRKGRDVAPVGPVGGGVFAARHPCLLIAPPERALQDWLTQSVCRLGVRTPYGSQTPNLLPLTSVAAPACRCVRFRPFPG